MIWRWTSANCFSGSVEMHRVSISKTISKKISKNNLQKQSSKKQSSKTIIPSAGRTFTAHEHVYPDDLHIAEM